MEIDKKTQTQLADALAKMIAYEDKVSIRDFYLKYTVPATKLLKRVCPEILEKHLEEARKAAEEEG